MSKIQLIEVEGSYYDVGFQMGSALKNKIKKTIKIPEKVAREHKFFKIDYFIKISQKYFPYANKYFPQYVTELKGIADGADQDFNLVWLLNTEEVLIDMYFDKCTSIILKENGNMHLYHNEDFEQTYANNLAIVKAKINNSAKFLSLTFAGMLPGSSVSVNSSGMVHGVNSLHPKDTKIGLPKNFIARALTEAKSVNDALKILKNKDRASAYNHILIQNGRAFSIETTADKYKILKVKEDCFAHTNNYLTKLRKFSNITEESTARYNKILYMLKNYKNPDHNFILRILKSHDKKAPICRHKNDSDITLASVIVDCNNLTMKVNNGSACRGEYEEFFL